jgi:hypothetical protein
MVPGGWHSFPANRDTPGSVQKMTEMAVLLTWVDQTCCSPARSVGDTFSSSIHNYQGLIYEERHPSGVSIATYPMTGLIRMRRYGALLWICKKRMNIRLDEVDSAAVRPIHIALRGIWQRAHALVRTSMN